MSFTIINGNARVRKLTNRSWLKKPSLIVSREWGYRCDETLFLRATNLGAFGKTFLELLNEYPREIIFGRRETLLESHITNCSQPRMICLISIPPNHNTCQKVFPNGSQITLVYFIILKSSWSWKMNEIFSIFLHFLIFKFYSPVFLVFLSTGTDSYFCQTDKNAWYLVLLCLTPVLYVKFLGCTHGHQATFRCVASSLYVLLHSIMTDRQRPRLIFVPFLAAFSELSGKWSDSEITNRRMFLHLNHKPHWLHFNKHHNQYSSQQICLHLQTLTVSVDMSWTWYRTTKRKHSLWSLLYVRACTPTLSLTWYHQPRW